MISNKLKYGVWQRRILPILEVSGWNSTINDGTTYMVNESIGQRFEYRYYGNSAPVWVGELEAIE